MDFKTLSRYSGYDIGLMPTINENKYPWNTKEFKNFQQRVIVSDNDSPPLDIGLFESNQNDAVIEPFYVVVFNIAGYNKSNLKVKLKHDTIEVSYKTYRGASNNLNLKMFSNEVFDKDFTKTIIFGSPIKVKSSKIENGLLVMEVRYHDPTSEVPVKID